MSLGLRLDTGKIFSRNHPSGNHQIGRKSKKILRKQPPSWGFYGFSGIAQPQLIAFLAFQRSEVRSQQGPSFSVVVAIDFGTTSSGYAFSFTSDPEAIHMMR